MNPFLMLPNWVDAMGALTMGIFLVGLMLVAASIWFWIVAEIMIFVYKQLHGRIMNLSV